MATALPASTLALLGSLLAAAVGAGGGSVLLVNRIDERVTALESRHADDARRLSELTQQHNRFAESCQLLQHIPGRVDAIDRRLADAERDYRSADDRLRDRLDNVQGRVDRMGISARGETSVNQPGWQH